MRGRARDPVLLFALGRLCHASQLWGKARASLEESLRLQPAPETLLALAELAEAMGEEAEAARRYREAALALQAATQEARRNVPERSFRREASV